MNNYPKIRDLHPVPYDQNGKPSFLLRDPLQLNGHMLVIPQAIAPLLYIADGTRDLSTLSTIMDYHYGIKVGTQELSDILAVFDDAFLLENERSSEAFQTALSEYRNADYRHPASAGGSYPADPAKLHRLLQDYLEASDAAPGDPGAAGVLSPHIDYDRGGHIYADVWKRAAASLPAAELIIVIGTDHYSGKNEITLTRQHYATPYGVLPTDIDTVDLLAEVIGPEAAFAGELFHKTEHSIELPLVWLHHLLGDRMVPVVPILCGNLDPQSDQAQRFMAALSRVTASRKAFVVISGDLSHVGPAFGGDPVEKNGRDAIRKKDHRLMSHLAAGSPTAFLEEILAIENANNVCGTYPLYLALQAFGFTHGEPAGYDQCPADEEGKSIVSIGGMIFH